MQLSILLSVSGGINGLDHASQTRGTLRHCGTNRRFSGPVCLEKVGGKKTLAMSVIRWQFYSLKNEPFNAIKFSGIDISVADFKDLIMKEKGMKSETSKLVVIDASNNEGNRV